MPELLTNFKYKSTQPNFERDQVLTHDDLVSADINDYDKGHIVYCVEDKTHYYFDGDVRGSHGWFKKLKTEISKSDIITYKVAFVFASGIINGETIDLTNKNNKQYWPGREIVWNKENDTIEINGDSIWNTSDEGLIEPIYMSTGIFYSNEEIGEWSTPIKASGNDGAEIMYVYTLTEDLSSPNKPSTKASDSWTDPDGIWSQDPTGISNKNRYEWVSISTKKYGQWSDWSTPSIWSSWGVWGKDGGRTEYAYIGLKEEDGIPTVDMEDGFEYSEDFDSNYQNIGDEAYSKIKPFKGKSWEDNPISLSAGENECIYMIFRKSFWKEDISMESGGRLIWGNFSEPVLWSKIGPQGESDNGGFVPNYKIYIYTKNDERWGDSGMTVPEIGITVDELNNDIRWEDVPTDEGIWYQCIGTVEVTDGKHKIISWSEILPLNGKDGAGEGIYTKFMFAKSDSDTPPSCNKSDDNPGSNWLENPPQRDDIGEHIWMINALFTQEGKLNDGHTWSDPVRISGDQGPGVTNVIEWYAVSSSKSESPAIPDNFPTDKGDWGVDLKTLSNDKQYLWNFEEVYITGADTPFFRSQPQVIGTAGRGIISITEYYAKSANNTVAPPRNDKSWIKSAPGVALPILDSDNKFLWNYEEILYTDSNTPEVTEAVVIGTFGDQGPKGDKGDKGDDGLPGADGAIGPKGAKMRMTDWVSESGYCAGVDEEEFYDIVKYQSQLYLCIKSHTSSSSKTPTNTTYWAPASTWKFIATDLMLAKKISADMIDVDSLTAVKLETTNQTGAKVEISNGLISVFGKSAMNIQFGVNDDGMAVLSYYNDAGQLLYDLGPEGIKKMENKGAAWSSGSYYRLCGSSIANAMSLNGTMAYKTSMDTYNSSEITYKYSSEIKLGVVQNSELNDKWFKFTRKPTNNTIPTTSDFISDGVYCDSATSQSQAGSDTEKYLMYIGDIGGSRPSDFHPANETVDWSKTVYFTKLYRFSGGEIVERQNVYWNS